MQQAVLQILNGPRQGQSIILAAAGTVLGRGSDSASDLSQYSEMSRKHVRIWQEQNQWMLEDMGSTNGVLLDGQKVQHAALKAGALLEMGNLQVRFALTEAEPVRVEQQLRRSGNTTIIRRLLETQAKMSRQLRLSMTGGGIAVILLLAVALWPHPNPSVLSSSVEQRVQSGVVFITCVTSAQQLPGGDANVSYSRGTGYLIDGQYILTNRHVVDNDDASGPGGALQIYNCKVVFFSGSGHEVAIDVPAANICAFNPASTNSQGVFDTDLALMRLPTPAPSGAASLALGDTADLQPTQHLFMEGFPEGGDTEVQKASTSVGEHGYFSLSPWPMPQTQPHDVSELERDSSEHLIALHLVGSAVQGDSGSPVVDSQGRVVGMCRSGKPGTMLQQSIPTNYIRAFLQKAENVLSNS